MTRRLLFAPLAALLSVVLATGIAWAGGIPAGVGGDPPIGPYEADENGYIPVGTETDPIPIYIDPDGDPWLKQFVIPPGTTIVPGQVFQVWENISIVPPPIGGPFLDLPLTDWHEEIHGSDPPLPFAWGGGHLVIHDPTHPAEVVGQVSSDGQAIWFDPIPPTFPPFDMWIHKELVYTGDVTLTPSHDPIHVIVWEHPTVPEPSALVLVVLGVVAPVAFVRRRREAR